jgi:hypothetical protein
MRPLPNGAYGFDTARCHRRAWGLRLLLTLDLTGGYHGSKFTRSKPESEKYLVDPIADIKRADGHMDMELLAWPRWQL